jgi:putative transposase
MPISCWLWPTCPTRVRGVGGGTGLVPCWQWRPARNIAEVVFHSDRGSTWTAGSFTTLCAGLKFCQSMGRVGSCFDNAAAESFLSTLEREVLSRHTFAPREQARQVISAWVEEFYNPRRRHSTLSIRSPIGNEQALVAEALRARDAA